MKGVMIVDVDPLDMPMLEMARRMGSMQRLPNGMEAQHLPLLTCGPGEVTLRPLPGAQARFLASLEDGTNPVLRDIISCFPGTNGPESETITPEEGTMMQDPIATNGLNVPEEQPQPAKATPAPAASPSRRARRRRGKSVPGFLPEDHNNMQANRVAAQARKKAKRKATLKMRKRARARK